LEVCKERKNYLGHALLVEKVGDGKEAIRILSKYIDLIDLKRLVEQLLVVSLQNSDVGKLSHFEYLSKFDSTLEKQTKIAAKKDPNDP
jgi:hypothetical protein